MSTVLDQLRSRHGLPQTKGTHNMTAEGNNLPQRMNYLTCGNIVELATDVVHGLAKMKIGMSDQLGEDRLLKRDFAAMVANRLTKRVEAAQQNRG